LGNEESEKQKCANIRSMHGSLSLFFFLAGQTCCTEITALEKFTVMSALIAYSLTSQEKYVYLIYTQIVDVLRGSI